MAMTVTTWTEEMVAHAVERIRAVGLRTACDELGKTEASVRSMLRDRRIDWRSPGLPTPPPVPLAPPSGGVDVSEPEPVDWRGARPQEHGEVERRLIIPDVHIPVHNAHALACVYAIARALQPHRIIQLGDLLNMEALSRHPPSQPERERFDLAMLAGRAFLRALTKASPGSEIHVLMGNHEGWAGRFAAEFPQFVGTTLDVGVHLGVVPLPDAEHPAPFEHVKLHYRPETEPLILGPVGYIHGNRGGQAFAKRYATDFGPAHGVRTLVVGHHHQLQVHRTCAGFECWGAGYLGNDLSPSFRYASEPRPWWHGVLVQDVVGDLVTTTPIPIVQGRALVFGRVVSA